MKKLSVIVLVLALATIMILPAGMAGADSAEEINGEYTITTTGAECINDCCGSGIYLVCFSFTGTYEGNLTGSACECLYCGLSACSDCIRSAGIMTFTGTVLDKKGSFTALIIHEYLRNGNLKVEQTIISGTDELDGIQGTMVFTVNQTEPGSWKGTCSGTISFDR